MTRKVSLEVELTEEQQRAIAWWMGGAAPALLVSRGLLCADRDEHATGRALVYRPTPRLLQLLGVETLEEARRRLSVPANYRS